MEVSSQLHALAALPQGKSPQKYGHMWKRMHYNRDKFTDVHDIASKCNADSSYQKFKYVE
jgi:hypothetical protein